tara:strand:- start:12 stop:443 length:432 start_codon:yes stop_codon:yes gene_type:complete
MQVICDIADYKGYGRPVHQLWPIRGCQYRDAVSTLGWKIHDAIEEVGNLNKYITYSTPHITLWDRKGDEKMAAWNGQIPIVGWSKHVNSHNVCPVMITHERLSDGNDLHTTVCVIDLNGITMSEKKEILTIIETMMDEFVENL